MVHVIGVCATDTVRVPATAWQQPLQTAYACATLVAAKLTASTHPFAVGYRVSRLVNLVSHFLR